MATGLLRPEVRMATGLLRPEVRMAKGHKVVEALDSHAAVLTDGGAVDAEA